MTFVSATWLSHHVGEGRLQNAHQVTRLPIMSNMGFIYDYLIY